MDVCSQGKWVFLKDTGQKFPVPLRNSILCWSPQPDLSTHKRPPHCWVLGGVRAAGYCHWHYKASTLDITVGLIGRSPPAPISTGLGFQSFNPCLSRPWIMAKPPHFSRHGGLTPQGDSAPKSHISCLPLLGKRWEKPSMSISQRGPEAVTQPQQGGRGVSWGQHGMRCPSRH